MNNPKQILIADAGGTKSTWLYQNTVTKQEKRFSTIGIHPLFLSARQIESIISKEVIPQLAGLESNQLQVFFYGTGCEAADRQGIVHQALQNTFSDAEIAVASDLLGATKALCGREKGIACILGTGSNSSLYNGEEIIKQQTSLGFWLGDEGSGGFMGKKILTDALRKKLPPDLQSKFTNSHRIDLDLTLKRMYQEPTPNQYAASFASFIRQNRGHEYIENLLDYSFGAFIALEILEYPNATEIPIHSTGGVAIAFTDAWVRNLEKHNLMAGNCIDDILPALAIYHQ